jgi:spore maturation protein CgeB
MKLARITTLYPSYITYFYRRNPEIVTEPYASQQSKLHYDAFGWADFWSHALKRFGIEVREIEMNVGQLQMNWAREKNIMFHTKKWMYEITEAQLKEFEPDILFINDLHGTTASWIKKIRTEIPSIKMIIGWYGAPILDTSVIKECDLMLSCIPDVVSQLQSDGMKAYHLNHAFDPRVLGRIDQTDKPSIEISFIGQIIRSNRFHLEREKLLLELLKHIDMKIYSPSATIPVKKKLMAPIRYLAYYLIQLLTQMSVPEQVFHKIPVLRNAAIVHEKPNAFVNPLLKPYLNKEVYGLVMFQTLHNSMITWNNHIDISRNSASNMRLFEATGSGACLLTDWKDNLPDIFEPGKEVVTYKSAEECIEKAKWLLENPHERRAIATAGQKRTLSEHTFTQRAEQLYEIIKNKL